MVAESAACFDSNIIIDHLRNVEAATQLIGQTDRRIISVVAWTEVMAKDIDSVDDTATRQTLSLFHKIELEAGIQEAAIRYRQKTGVKLPDAIIYATAQEKGALLYTRNTKDFPADDPLIRVPYHI